MECYKCAGKTSSCCRKCLRAVCYNPDCGISDAAGNLFCNDHDPDGTIRVSPLDDELSGMPAESMASELPPPYRRTATDVSDEDAEDLTTSELNRWKVFFLVDFAIIVIGVLIFIGYLVFPKSGNWWQQHVAQAATFIGTFLGGIAIWAVLPKIKRIFQGIEFRAWPRKTIFVGGAAVIILGGAVWLLSGKTGAQSNAPEIITSRPTTASTDKPSPTPPPQPPPTDAAVETGNPDLNLCPSEKPAGIDRSKSSADLLMVTLDPICRSTWVDIPETWSMWEILPVAIGGSADAKIWIDGWDASNPKVISGPAMFDASVHVKRFRAQGHGQLFVRRTDGAEVATSKAQGKPARPPSRIPETDTDEAISQIKAAEADFPERQGKRPTQARVSMQPAASNRTPESMASRRDFPLCENISSVDFESESTPRITVELRESCMIGPLRFPASWSRGWTFAPENQNRGGWVVIKGVNTDLGESQRISLDRPSDAGYFNRHSRRGVREEYLRGVGTIVFRPN